MMRQNTIPVNATSEVGWYGKLPAAGDFLQRRLSNAFRDPWDRWLCEGLIDAQNQLGEQWEEIYLSFPVHRFLWNSARADEPIWVGVLLPGVDRVGRMFPLTIAEPIARDQWLKLDASALETGLAEFERLALLVLQDDDIDQFDAALIALPRIAPNSSTGATTARAVRDFANWAQTQGMNELLRGPPVTLFWSCSGENELGAFRVETNPPAVSCFKHLITTTASLEQQQA